VALAATEFKILSTFEILSIAALTIIAKIKNWLSKRNLPILQAYEVVVRGKLFLEAALYGFISW